MFSGWAAKCTQINPPNVNSCSSTFGGDFWNPQKSSDAIPYLWTDITYLLYQHGITWLAYLDGGLGGPIGPPERVRTESGRGAVGEVAPDGRAGER